jgi:4-alpha-glucanotransferase
VGDLVPLAGRLPGDLGGMHLASHALVAQSPARLKLWGLGDAVGDRRRPNQPGAVWPDYPSFRLPLADASGRDVPLPTVLRHPGVDVLGQLGSP